MGLWVFGYPIEKVFGDGDFDEFVDRAVFGTLMTLMFLGYYYLKIQGAAP